MLAIEEPDERMVFAAQRQHPIQPAHQPFAPHESHLIAGEISCNLHSGDLTGDSVKGNKNTPLDNNRRFSYRWSATSEAASSFGGAPFRQRHPSGTLHHASFDPGSFSCSFFGRAGSGLAARAALSLEGPDTSGGLFQFGRSHNDSFAQRFAVGFGKSHRAVTGSGDAPRYAVPAPLRNGRPKGILALPGETRRVRASPRTARLAPGLGPHDGYGQR